MTSLGRQYSTASPVLAMQPRPSHQPPLSATSLAHHHAPSPSLWAGRKRPRDEASANLEGDAPSPVADKSQQGWTYAEGMVLIKPETGYVADASSQSGTWLEDKMASDEQASRRRQHQQMGQGLGPRSHKSQRMDSSTGQASSHKACNGDAACAAGESARQPVIDDWTLQLGIGWRSISDDEHMQAAARGWARFIEKNFALAKVRICLESKGLQSYLVEAREGYFLFAENLRHGRLVSQTVDGALGNLRRSPPTFDGPEMLMETADCQSSEACADTEMRVD